ncbi:MAG: 30S ribosomal protein S12 methylthiotransferase RimO [Bacillota bacterium]|nr:30S ribosomal protein S12 methylthiotransferase RimO [Bacillota bacterium]
MTPFFPGSFYLLSLGCAKNLVDAECMSQILKDTGWAAVSQPKLADVLIVNTCGFIDSAKKEAIEAILSLASCKQPAGRARFLVVTGCLSQRYAKDIRKRLPEVDAVLGTADYGQIAELLQQLESGRDAFKLPGLPGSIEHLCVARQPSTPSTYAWIKIAEGCSNHCTYCAIPGIRGELRSRPIEDIEAEAARLSEAGFAELILIAQDTGRYGIDLYGRRCLPELLTALCHLPHVRMVRILYTYSDGITDELISVMQHEKKIARYLDMPIQHGSDRILHLMNRHDDAAGIEAVVSRLRTAMPDIILRTTVMVGFPGETEEDYQQLLALLRSLSFERLGCFIFSPEEGTAAWNMHPRVHHQTAKRRYRNLMKQQQAISAEAAARRIGQIVPVTLESVDDSGIFYIGRSYGETPDVDPVIYVAAASANFRTGQTCLVRLVEADAYEMTGVTVL